MKTRAGRAQVWIVVALAGAGTALALWYGHFSASPQKANPEPPDYPLPPFSQSRYLNTGPEARFIGSAACAVCHQQNHLSYLHTSHSRSLSVIDPGSEPPDGAFTHKPTGRHYRVYRQDGRIRHEEVLRSEQGQEMARVDVPVRYLMGSGQYSRSYLFEAEGFLHQSPLAWYESRKSYGMAPGYDAPKHWGFERPVRLGCFACHAGRVEEADGAVHRFQFHELSIGCENCHGPGSLHQDLHRSRKLAPGEEDLTIVHPGKLSRPRLESICANCHQSAQASILLRGRKPTDFRPGQPLDDYRIHYYSKLGNEQMTVVGHIEQLRESACYKKSAGLTCVSCHDPHQRERTKDSLAFYRAKCLNCHESIPCKLDPIARLKKEPKDDCTACHMPRGDTDIPHVAFTHHRIGLHTAKPSALPEGPVELVSTDDLSRLAAIDRERNLGLAYFEMSQNKSHAQFAETYSDRARHLLETVHEQGLRDGVTSSALAEIYRVNQDFSRASSHAREAVAASDTPSYERAQCLLILADHERASGDYPAAIAHLEDAVKLLRSATNWRMLGICRLEHDEPLLALPALQKALEIRPYRHTTSLGLSLTYRRLGDEMRAREALDRANWLERHNQE